MSFTVYRSPFAARRRGSLQALRTLRRANPLDEPRQHLLDVRDCAFQYFSLPWSEKSQVLRQQNKANQLVCGTGGYVQELPELGAGRSSTPLRDISGYGSRCSSHLAGQAEPLGRGVSSGGAINTQRQSLAPLPYFQFPEVLHVFTPSCSTPQGVTLAHEYNAKQVSSSRIALAANDKRQTANPFGEQPC